jgi:hypothetical protein
LVYFLEFQKKKTTHYFPFACATQTLAYGDTKVPAAQVHATFLTALKSYGQVITTEKFLTQLKG